MKRLVLDDVAEVRTPPGPVVVHDDVRGACLERSAVSVELARLVRRMTRPPHKAGWKMLRVYSCCRTLCPVPGGQVYTDNQLTLEMSTAHRV